MRDLISVVIPIYNAEKTLSKCLDSVLSQTYENLEIILVDDGSNDNSSKIIDGYASRHKCVKVIHIANSGPSAARNIGISEATGKYIGFVDADDYLEKNIYANLYSYLIKNKTQVAVCGWFVHKGDQVEIKGQTFDSALMPGKKAIHNAIRGGKFDGYLWNKLFDVDIINQIIKESGSDKLFDEQIYICEDLLLCCQVFAKCDEIYYNPVPLYHYIVHDKSAIRVYDKQSRETEMVAREQIIQLTKPIDKELWYVAQFTYTQAALDNIYNANKSRNYGMRKRMRKESKKYIFQSLFYRGVGIKAKLRLFVMFIAPIYSIDLWLAIKKKLGVKAWSKATDK